MTYAEKLKDQRWQDLRRRILLRDGRKCRHCGATGVVLDVHHCNYTIPRSDPWVGKEMHLITLCRKCHETTEIHVNLCRFVASLPKSRMAMQILMEIFIIGIRTHQLRNGLPRPNQPGYKPEDDPAWDTVLEVCREAYFGAKLKFGYEKADKLGWPEKVGELDDVDDIYNMYQSLYLLMPVGDLVAHIRAHIPGNQLAGTEVTLPEDLDWGPRHYALQFAAINRKNEITDHIHNEPELLVLPSSI